MTSWPVAAGLILAGRNDRRSGVGKSRRAVAANFSLVIEMAYRSSVLTELQFGRSASFDARSPARRSRRTDFNRSKAVRVAAENSAAFDVDEIRSDSRAA